MASSAGGPVAEGGQQLVPGLRGQALGGQVAQRGDGGADLVQVPVAAVAPGQVFDEPLLGGPVQRALEVGGDQLDELLASHATASFDQKVSSAARSAARPRCSCTRRLAGLMDSIAQPSSLA